MEPEHYHGIDGETAYLAGVLRVLTDNFSVLVGACLPYHTVEADIYRIGMGSRLETIQHTLRHYSCGPAEEATERELEIDRLTLEWEPVDRTFPQIFSADCSRSETIATAVEKYWQEWSYFVGNAKKIFRMATRSDIRALERAYLGIVFSLYLVEYDEYLVLICLGSAE